MNRLLRSIIKPLVDLPVALLPRSTRIRLGRYILDKASGDNDGEARTNGEYYVVSKVRQHLAGQPAVIFDVGANLGEWTAAVANGARETWRIYSFEPCTKTYQRLAQSLASIPAATPVNAALGSQTTRASLNVTGDFAGTQSFVRRDSVGLMPVAVEEVAVTTGDEFCREHEIDQIAFLKIDTEGYELEVLKGFEQMLQQRRIACLQFEYGGSWIDARILLKDAFAQLQPSGYTLAKIHPRGIEVFERYDARLEHFQFANYLAMRNDRLGIFDRIH